MRIESGAPIQPSGRGDKATNDRKVEKRAEKKSDRDSVQISPEARSLHDGSIISKSAARVSDSALDESRISEIRERLESGYYDSKEVLLTVAVRVLEVFGI